MASCSAEDGVPRCVAGQASPCACTSGRNGAQVCNAAGAFGPCVCAGDEDAVIEPDGLDDVADSAVEDIDATLDSHVDDQTDGDSTGACEDVDCPCPTPVIVVAEGDEVVPGTMLHLDGSQSFAAVGSIAAWKWRVSQPGGAPSIFMPSSTVANPRFEVNVAGHYAFELSVVDSNGQESCAPARAEVFVVPDEALHVELVWDTPGDSDQLDEGPVAGANLDLHFLHPFASGNYDGDGDGAPDGYFDSQFDCFWFNSDPNWGGFDAAVDDDPRYLRDDPDGAGPETVSLNLPEADKCYRIGVHYWDDNHFGTSEATVRVYVYANLVFELTDVPLVNHDMWSVTRVCWPPDGNAPEPMKVCAGTTTPCASAADCNDLSCDLRIAHDYVHPFFPTD